MHGRSIPSHHYNAPLEPRFTKDAESGSNLDGKQHMAALRHRDFFKQGWTALATGAIKQRWNRRNGPLRRETTFFVPKVVTDKLKSTAEAAGVLVTKHDILMALVHQVCARSGQAKENG